MQIDDVLSMDGLTVDILKKLSYQSKLPLSLSRRIKDFDKKDLLDDLFAGQEWLDEQIWNFSLNIDYRIKSRQSIRLKYERYFETGRVNKTFNDVLGFRTICDNYDNLRVLLNDSNFRIIDESNGKKVDNGYRGVHVYFQIDNNHYPIEIQYNTAYDRYFNNWLHKYVYKKYPAEIGAYLRKKYEMGYINSENKFKEVFKDVLSSC